MADKASRTPDEQGIFQSLPASRPQRRSAKRAPSAGHSKTTPTESAVQSATAPTETTRAPAQSPIEPPTNGDIINSALTVVVELAQAGLSLSERLLAEATRRVPKR